MTSFGNYYLRGFLRDAIRGGVCVGTDGEDGNDVIEAIDGVDMDVEMIAIDDGTGDGGGRGGVDVMEFMALCCKWHLAHQNFF